MNQQLINASAQPTNEINHMLKTVNISLSTYLSGNASCFWLVREMNYSQFTNNNLLWPGDLND